MTIQEFCDKYHELDKKYHGDGAIRSSFRDKNNTYLYTRTYQIKKEKGKTKYIVKEYEVI